MKTWRILLAVLFGEIGLVVVAFTPSPLGLLFGLLPMMLSLALAQNDGALRR